ncbi:unnamed protein product [Mytilus edulis]|uniref:Uncharacterized protein n=1 Tax=Mytilus edulis TaxID=6550 RepID=A0A8S3RME4_MYTED|nr:unnamed protein product [Mytilus edulis]
MDFADPQGGKSICDRRAAHIKSAIRKYVNEGHGVCTTADFKKALQICSLRNVAVVVALPPETSNKKEIKSKIQNITTLNNFAYQQTGIRVFRQYGIGEGKFLTNDKFIAKAAVVELHRLVLEKRKTACNSYDEEDMEAGIAAETLEELQVLARN